LRTAATLSGSLSLIWRRLWLAIPSKVKQLLRRLSLSRPSGPSHHGGRKVPDGRGADLLHDTQQLGPQQLQHALHARLAERAEAPDIGASNADRGRAHAQRLADVGAAAEAGVDQDRDAAVDGFDDLRKRIDRGTAGVFAPV